MISDKILETELLQRICKPLLDWYDENSRHLEWRRNPLPYYVWVSEIMLQQTRVEAVKPYFSRFVRELPDIRSLAQCEEDRLFKLWEGLGYYSRARNLRKAAGIVLDRYGGELPCDVDALKKLPGIGSYTAGAIASIAFALPEPAVDGNVLRVLSRITACRECIDEAKVKTAYENLIREYLSRDLNPVSDLSGEQSSVSDLRCSEAAWRHPGKFNQALMELGAVVCLPNGAPVCEACPVQRMCVARQQNQTQVIPVRKKKSKRRIEKKTVLVIRDTSRALIRKRPEKGLLAGLWELPNYEGHLTSAQALKEAERLGVSAIRILPLPTAVHIFTHVQWEMTGYRILAEELNSETTCRAVPIDRIRKEYSIPSAFSRYAGWLYSDSFD